MKINNSTKIIISASSSPGNFGSTLYNKFFKTLRLNYIYIPMKFLKLGKLRNMIQNQNIYGCSISMPFKNKLAKIVKYNSTESKLTGSINTVIKSNNKLLGYNTDVFGIKSVLKKKNFNSVLILGNGGVVKSILFVLKHLKRKTIYIKSRNINRLNRTIKEHRIKRFNNFSKQIDLIINATPLKKINEIEKYIPKEIILKCKLFFDLNVSQKDTNIIKFLKRKKINSISGIDMTKYQFQRQFYLYTGKLIKINSINQNIKKLYKL
tara:strand:+ start:157 stop:951 length:795 start_codon:yes stop_codon:yes gene_type:complete